MPFYKKIKSRSAGMTLIELLVAMAVLVVVVAPILGVYVMGTRISSNSYKLTIASVTAQMRMEELVGLTESELRGRFDFNSGNTISHSSDDYNGFPVKAEVTFNYSGFSQLAEAVVTVYDMDGVSVLCTQTNVLNVTPGGL